jgi:Carboxypeptidase regulatory-like domain
VKQEQEEFMTVTSRLRVVVRALVLLAAAAVPAAAQITTGTIVGNIKDAQGGVIPGATITLVSGTRGTTLATAVSNADGDYVFPNVPPDTYLVRVTMDGFKTIERSGIAVSPGDRVAIPALTIEVGGLEETVTVAGESPLIQSRSGERSFTVATDAVQNLPLLNRSFTSLTSLAPGVDVSGNNPARLGGGGSNNTLMDGVSTVDTGNNQPVLFLNVEAIAEVKVLTSGYQAEYGKASGIQITAVTKSGTNQLRGSIYDVHRDSDWNSNSWANIKNGNPKAVNKEDDWGYSIGGPIGKPGGRNKLFFFFSQEWRPRTTAGAIQRFRFPTALERNGDFSQTRDNNGALYNLIRDASTNLPCTATNTSGCFQDGGVVGRIPQQRLYQPGLNILRQYPMPNIDGTGLAYNYEAPAPEIKTLNNQPAVRIDYQPIQPLRAIFRYAAEMQRREVFPGSIPGFNDVQTQNPIIPTIAASVNYTINPTTFLEVTYGRIQNELAGCTTLTGVCANAIPMGAPSNKLNVGLGDLPLIFPDGLGMDSRYYEYKTLEKIAPPFWQNGQILLPPTFNWGGRIANGPPNIAYPAWLNLNRTTDVAVSLTKVWGRHTIKGGYYNHYSFKAQNRGTGGLNFGGPGAMNFGNNTSNPIDSTFGFANAALGIINSYQQMSRFMEGSFIYNNREGYVQDNWKATSKLTLDYGVRIVHQQPQYDELGQSANFLPEQWDPSQVPLQYVAGCANGVYPCSGNNRQAMHPVTGAFLGPGSALSIGQLVPGTGNLTNGIFLAGQGIVKSSYKWPALALAPRFGFAYDISGNQNLILRGATGLFYDRPDGNSIYGLVANPPNASTVTINFGQLQTLRPGGIQGPPALTVYQYESDLPSSVQWSTGVQMALPWSSVLDVSYVGQYGYNLGQTVDINQVDIGSAYLAENQDRSLSSAIPGGAAVSTDLMRSYSGYGQINQFWGRGWNKYHAIQTSFNRRFSDGLSFGLNWTLGLSNDTNAGARLEHSPDGSLRYRADQEEADRLLGRGQLQRHTLKGTFVWDLPDLERGSGARRVLAAVTNDWQLSGIFTGQSGDRYSIGYGYQGGIGNVNITGSPNYGGRVVINGDTGSGCSDDQYRQFNTDAFSGPTYNSVGLESGQNYLTGCFERFIDLAIARNFRLGGSRMIQLRLEMFNAFNTVVYSNRNTTVNFQSPTDQTVTNPQFDAQGNLVPTRVRPTDAGFGAATNAFDLRRMQAQIRFQF